MIFKKYRIGPIGDCSVIYRRIKIKDIITTDVCSSCGIGLEECKDLPVYSIRSEKYKFLKSITFNKLCCGDHLLEVLGNKTNNTEKNITYIPWKIR